MGLNARSKGRRGEMMAVEFMKEWTAMDFRRTPGSGGLRGHVLQYSTGDIVCVTPNVIFPFVLEIKNYKNLNFQHLLYDVDSEIEGFWKQVLADSIRGKKLPLLLMRYNGLPKNFFFMMTTLQVAKILFNKKPKKSFIYQKRIICGTDYLLKVDYKQKEKALLKLLIP